VAVNKQTGILMRSHRLSDWTTHLNHSITHCLADCCRLIYCIGTERAGVESGNSDGVWCILRKLWTSLLSCHPTDAVPV
jgi:hypothetical protein